MKHIRPRVRCLPAAAAALLWFATAATAAPLVDVFFYSPEFVPKNLAVLRETAERYFKEQELPVRFQPFARYRDMEVEFARRTVAFALVPPWVLDQSCFGRTFFLLAEPVRAGSTLDRKTVVASRGAQELKTGTIAVSGPTSHVREKLLAGFLATHPRLRLLTVPKDLDALLAVSFGQVEAAFVSSAQLQALGEINPALTASLVEIGYAVETPFPRFYATDHADDAAVHLMLVALEAMQRRESGRRLLAVLGYEHWRLSPRQARSPVPCGPGESGETER
ncbi:MAG: hypothetical protein D6815_04345 [Candidatus Dadabacteria bacterium]|nr:MAG: hypothetical protein D6815_04345 [Candidatus Dadabacteria bacterium]